MKLLGTFLGIILLFSPMVNGQEVLIPSAHNVKDQALFSNFSNELVGEGFFPISYNKSNYKFPTKDTLKQRNWFVRKLLHEHLVQIEKDGVIFTLDPLLELKIGKDMVERGNPYVFQNTRGAQASGDIKGIISFYTAFYENQARFSPHETAYFKSRGELYPKSGGNSYSIQNAVIPNGGRTKPFKTGGFDYASAMSYVRVTPIPQLAVQLGNMPRFFGWGYRSMLMSDNSYNYTHLDIDWEILPGLSYTVMRGQQLNLYRKVHTKLIERPYEKKGIGVHYLSYRVLPSLVVGLFESTIYLRDEAKTARRVNSMFYVPVIGANTIATQGKEKNGMKSMLGINAAWKFHKEHMIYAQFASDDFRTFQYGVQFGYRIGNLFGAKNLFLQAEFNMASNFMYAAENQRMAYTHFNLPLAHTLGNGFQEVILRGSYKWRGIYIDGTFMFYRANQQMKGKTTLFSSKNNTYTEDKTQVIYVHGEIGYELNPATRLRVYFGGDMRINNSASVGKKEFLGVLSFGLRSSLRNQYFDF